MLCNTCVGMLRDNKGQFSSRDLVLMFTHHKTFADLRRSVREDCSICMDISKHLEQNLDLADDGPLLIQAYLEKVEREPEQSIEFSLVFNLNRSYTRVFVLREIEPNQIVRSVKSSTTSSHEVLVTAQTWIKQCRCAGNWKEPGPKWYPRRLLDLDGLRNANGNMHRAKVRLIESKDVVQGTSTAKATNPHKGPNDPYVTLSHCWGRPQEGVTPLKLTSETMERFMNEGICLEELPNTYRDAVTFAYRLGNVRFVWIDSLCIRQPIIGQGYNDEEQLSDWAEQSRSMDKVYQNAYLNISATASKDSNDGLFRKRKPEHIQTDVVEVRHPACKSLQSTKNKPAAPADLFRCTIVSPSVYYELLDRAPVNQRGWVVQERFLAPRILHFCENQIAWECSGIKDAEYCPDSMSILETQLQCVLPDDHIRDPETQAGRMSRENRLDGLIDPDSGMQDLYVYELWRSVVNAYTRTEVSFASDKLVALSGLASHFHQHLFSTCETRSYLAGLWNTNLESQLLWYVNKVHKAGVLSNPARRITGRAPSWSWAALDTPNGVTCGDITDYGAALAAGKNTIERDGMETLNPDGELLCKVLDYCILLVDAKSTFGMVKGGHILLEPRFLRRIKLLRLPPERELPYAWHLKATDVEQPDWDHTNISLDAPDSDTEIFQDTTKLFVMPVAYGPRTVRKDARYLDCLLLKFEGVYAITEQHVDMTAESQYGYRSFTRFGTTRLSYDFWTQREALQAEEIDEVICLL